jgi:tetratricopeptide (TPR) repeat protein
MQQAIQLIQGKNYIEALKILSEIIKAEPDNGFALGKSGFCHIQMGELVKAENKFALATKYTPDDPWAWQYYGFILFQLGKITESIKALKKAVKFNPKEQFLYHQIAFLYYQNKDYANALNYAEKSINLSDGQDTDLLNLRTLVLEHIDKKEAENVYFSRIKNHQDDPIIYDRLANLIIDKFDFSKSSNELNNEDNCYKKATMLLRSGNLDNAIGLYKECIADDKYCYPAYLGIAQALYEKMFGTRHLEYFEAPEGIERLFRNYNELNETEKNIINASVKPFENYIEKLADKNSFFILAPIDMKLTDYPENLYLKDANYLDTSYCQLRGIGGDNAFVGIERIRDFLWNISNSEKFIPACIAHEFGHQAWCLFDQKTRSGIAKLYKRSLKNNGFISKYSSGNVEEYFAEYYAYYARLSAYKQDMPVNDPMIEIIEELKT